VLYFVVGAETSNESKFLQQLNMGFGQLNDQTSSDILLSTQVKGSPLDSGKTQPLAGDTLQSCKTSSNGIFYNIPGTGSITNDQCGSVRGAHKCEDPLCGHVELRHYQCHNYECPTCYRSAAHQAGLRIEDRLTGVSSELRRYGVRTGYPVHVILSPPPGSVLSTSDIPRLKRETVYRYCKDIGMIGGVAVFHPYRIVPELKKALREYNKNNDPGKFWDLVHKDILQLGSWKDYVVWSPHFHILGYFPSIKEKSNDFEKRTGWMYKNLKKTDSICKSVSYLLTHHAYKKGSTGYTYFGHFSYSKVEAVSHRHIVEAVRCEKCGSCMDEWINFDVNPDGSVNFDRAEELGPAQISRKETKFRLKKWILKAFE